MPTRLLKEGMLDSDAMNSLSDQAEVFYRRLFQVVDDYGRFDGRLDILRFRLFPLKSEQWPVERVKDALEECTRAMRKPGEPLIRLYMSDGKPYVEITKFDQRRRTKSKYPDPPLLAIVSNCEQPLAIVRPVGGVSEGVVEYEGVVEGESEGVAHARPPLPEEPVNRDPNYDPYPGFLRFRTIAKRLADHRWSNDTEHAWIAVVFSPDVERAVFAGLERWQASRDWGDGIFKGWAKWLRELDFEKNPRGRTGNAALEQTRDNLREWAETDDSDSPGGLRPSFSDLCEGD